MAFWSDRASSPKLSFRWMLTLGSSHNAISTYTVKSFQKPSFSIGVAEYININDISYKPGILSWKPIEIVLIDSEDYDDNNSNKLFNILKNGGYINEQAGVPQAAIIKKEIQQQLGGQIIFNYFGADGSTAEPIEEWILKNPFITQINFGQANYAADELMTISMTIQYDSAEYNLH